MAGSRLDVPHVPPAHLDVVGEELGRLGYTVVPHGADLCVRLPLLCSVRLRAEKDGIRFIAKFGPFGRSGGLLVTTAASTALVAGTAFGFGLSPVTLVATFVGLGALITDACRFIVTEGCLTRLQQLISRSRD